MNLLEQDSHHCLAAEYFEVIVRIDLVIDVAMRCV